MSRDIPAALASIKRYSMPEFGHDLREDKDGFLFYVKDILAALLPPADGAVARKPDEYQFFVPSTGNWCNTSKGAYEIMKGKGGYRIRALYAVPPADSAMVEALCDLLEKVVSFANSEEGSFTSMLDSAERARELAHTEQEKKK